MYEKTKTDLNQYPATLTVHQTGEILKCCDRTVLNKLRSGEIPGVKIGKSWAISKDVVRRILEGDLPSESQEVAS